jgi:hypothetical protein
MASTESVEGITEKIFGNAMADSNLDSEPEAHDDYAFDDPISTRQALMNQLQQLIFSVETDERLEAKEKSILLNDKFIVHLIQVNKDFNRRGKDRLSCPVRRNLSAYYDDLLTRYDAMIARKEDNTHSMKVYRMKAERRIDRGDSSDEEYSNNPTPTLQKAAERARSDMLWYFILLVLALIFFIGCSNTSNSFFSAIAKDMKNINN